MAVITEGMGMIEEVCGVCRSCAFFFFRGGCAGFLLWVVAFLLLCVVGLFGLFGGGFGSGPGGVFFFFFLWSFFRSVLLRLFLKCHA